MAAVHILICEMAGFKIVPFIATHVKKKKKIMELSANQNSPSCMKTTDIKLFNNTTKKIVGQLTK